MGGKTKQSQRTKNNVRPSSSSRSAELLNNTVPMDGVLVKLSTGNVMPALFPTLVTTAANFEHVLNPEFQMCVKKLNKKDPITKTKALQELCELVNSTSVEDVVAALPTWVHFYRILTVDSDRKVREMTQVCQGAVARACGRRLAPHLKQLVAPWLQAQRDEHAPAATAARAALQNTFPDSKLPEVISFCKVEIMANLTDNLVGNAEAAISKKTDSAEEKDLQLCRLVTSSLQGLEYFTQHLPVAHDEWLWAELTALLQTNVFWKYGTHTSQPVRAAWYSAIGRLIERYKSTYGVKYGLKTMRMLLAAAKEQNTLVAAQLWGCLLLFIYNIEGWQTYLDKKELFIKRILDVLENGGWGDAKHLSNMLLPLLARLPQDFVSKEFYEEFFKAIFVGLQKKNILNSKSERQSWITSLAECLRYVSVQQDDFVVGVVTGVHRSWLENVLCTQLEGPIRTNLIKWSATNMTSILKYWLKQSTEGNSEKYDQLVRNFWQNVGSTILVQIEKCSIDQDEITNLIDGHILFLQILKISFFQEIKNQQSIKFDGDQQPVAERATPSAPQCDAPATERYKHNLDELVQRVCSRYFEFATRTELCSTIVTPLITLLVDFDSKNLFEALARQFDVDTVYKFYDKVLKSWLTGDTMRCKAVVDVVFLMMKHLTEQEQDIMFNTFKQFPPSVEEWCMSVCISHPHRARRSVRRWVCGADAAQCVARVCSRAVRDADCRAKNLLLMCLTSHEDGEPVISKAAVTSIIETLTAAISDVECPTLEHSGALAAQLATTLHERAVDAHYVRLVHALFKLSARVPPGDPRLSVDTWQEVCSSWQDGVAALPDEQRAVFLQDIVTFVHTELLQDREEFNISRAEHVVSLCPHLFSHLDGALHLVPAVNAFTELLLDAPDDCTAVETFALRHECVTSQLNCLDECDNETIRAIISEASDRNVAELTKTDLVLYVKRVLFRAIYLRSVLVHRVSRDEEQEGWCDALLADGCMAQHLCGALRDCVVLHSLHDAYAFWPHYDIIKESKEKLDSLLSDIIASSSQHTRSKMTSILTELAAVKGYYWSYARRWYEVHSGADTDSNDTEKTIIVKLEDVISGYGFFHSLQATTKWSSGEDRAYEINYMVMLRSFHAAHVEILTDAFMQELVACHTTCNLDVIINAYYGHQDTMLYDRDITEAPWANVLCNVAVTEFLAHMVQRCGWTAPAHHWDFTTITLCSLLTSVHMSKHSWGCSKVAMLTCSVLRLFRAVQLFVSGVSAESERHQPPPHVANLTAEWRDIFAPDLYQNLFSTALHLLESCASTPVTSNHIRVLDQWVLTTRHMDWRLVPAPLRADQLSLQRLAGAVARALRDPLHHAYKYFAYYLGTVLAEPLAQDDATKLSLWSDENQAEGEEEKERPEFSLDYFHDAFTHLQEIVEAALSNVVVGEETCEMVPLSDSHSVALGWLLLLDLMAELSARARGDLIQHHIQMYRERQYVEPLLSTALRLLPAPVFESAQRAALTPPAHLTRLFHQLDLLDVNAVAGGEVGVLACRALRRGVCGAGCGGARRWAAAAPRAAARLLEQLVCAYVTPRALRDQLHTLQQRAVEIENAQVRVAWSTREVSCVYHVDERQIEVRVFLSRSHPLAAPRLDASDAAGPGTNTQWLAHYLAYQNGTLLNALKMWTKAVSAHVESTPQCYICYCRLHPTTGRLPRVPCHQCNNKFHSVCLRKWFKTSTKASCPLCRSSF